MNSKTAGERGGAQWAEHVVARLRACGYFYDPDFSSSVDSVDVLVQAAGALGSVLIPAETDVQRPVLLTRPSRRAPKWRPFDSGASIGWHSDFSTWRDRPVLSLSWIRRQDPEGADVGAWRVASVRAVLAKLADSAEGRTLVDELWRDAHPFGYLDAGHPVFFRLLSRRGLFSVNYFCRLTTTIFAGSARRGSRSTTVGGFQATADPGARPREQAPRRFPREAAGPSDADGQPAGRRFGSAAPSPTPRGRRGPVSRRGRPGRPRPGRAARPITAI